MADARAAPPPTPDRSNLAALRDWAIVLSLCLVAVAIAIQYFVFDRLLPPAWAAVATAALLVFGVAGFSAAIWRLLERLEFRLRAAYAGERAQRRQAQGLVAASIAIATELDMNEVCQRIVDRSREVTGARYGALGVMDEAGHIASFHTSGIDATTRARIGPMPQGLGLLGLVGQRRTAVVVDDIRSHPAAAGFPPPHPPMQRLLAVPVWLRQDIIGNLYVCDREDGAPFSAEDTEALERFAAQAAVAIQNARLHRRLQNLSIVAERERIAMDLHDGVIQSLFAVRLQLEAALAGQAPESPLRPALDGAIDRLGAVMGDIRHYIFDLKSDLDLDQGEALPARLRQLLSGGGSMATHLEVSGTPQPVARRVQWEIWHICQEAVTNAMRHSRGRELTVELRYAPEALALTVADDGPGWDGMAAGQQHHGLQNMRRRAEAAGGTWLLEAAPGAGTRVTVRVPAQLAYTTETGTATTD